MGWAKPERVSFPELLSTALATEWWILQTISFNILA